MTSITEHMRDMPADQARAYKDGVERGMTLILDITVARFQSHPDVVQWALDKRARLEEYTA